MRAVRIQMGMPVTIEVLDNGVTKVDFEKIFEYFDYVDKKFSTYKKDSEIEKINRGELSKKEYTKDMKEILDLCEKTKMQTIGYFDITHKGRIDPSGLVKGWAIWNAAKMLKKMGFKNYFVDVGSDIQVSGKAWTVGIRNPFNVNEIIKVLKIKNKGVATSGTYERGMHVYNPHINRITNDIVSLTVIGPNIYEADRFATAAFAMGREGIIFLEKLKRLEGYMIDKEGIATYTSGFSKYTTP
jgi:thiamine biosynthesis lipoprotein